MPNRRVGRWGRWTRTIAPLFPLLLLGACASPNRTVQIGPIDIRQEAAQQAMQAANQAVKRYPQAAESYLNRALANWNAVESPTQADADAILNDCDHALRLNSKLDKAYVLRGDVYALVQKQHDRAIANYSRAIQLNSNNLDARVGRANERVFLNDMSGAIADYTQVIQLEAPFEQQFMQPSGKLSNASKARVTVLFKTYESRGYAYLRANQRQPAIADFQKTLTLAKRAGYEMPQLEAELNKLR